MRPARETRRHGRRHVSKGGFLDGFRDPNGPYLRRRPLFCDEGTSFMPLALRTHRLLVSSACSVAIAASANADRFVRFFGTGTSAPSFCSGNGSMLSPSELIATNSNGDVLVFKGGTSPIPAADVRRGWGTNGSGIYSWPPSGMAPEQCKDFAVDVMGTPLFHTQVALGNGHAAVICDAQISGGYFARTVVAWGANDQGQCEVAREPWGTPLYQVVQVACGARHTLARRSNGHVRAWGSNAYGQSSVPAGIYTGMNVDVVDIAAGGLHSIARHADGRLTCWGAGAPGDPVDNNIRCGQANPPVNLGPVSAVAAGSFHTAALRPDGTVVCWGAGSTDATYNFNVRQSMVPANLGPCVRVAASTYATVALTASGTVRVWGWSQDSGLCDGQCDLPAELGSISTLMSSFLGVVLVTDRPRSPCPSDLVASCNVDGADLGVLLASWGSNPAVADADLDGDSVVDGQDLGILLAAWGSCAD